MNLCEQLKTEYSQLENLKKEFEQVFDEAVKTGDTTKAKQLKKEIQEKLQSLKEKIIPKEIKANFKNPETNQTKEITINIQEKIQEFQEFYKSHNLPIPNEQEIKKIFQKNKAEIQKEIETYGYDNVLIVPENLPNTSSLEQKMTEGYVATWTGDNFNQANGFVGAKHTESQKAKIILTHNDQNIYQNQNANPFAKATLDKDIMQLSGLTQSELARRIQNKESIPINFEKNINGKNMQVEAEGLSLNEYLILQRQYFEKNQKHLDEKGWTWLPKSFSASRVCSSGWVAGDSQLAVTAGGLGISGDALSCRLSRSFELA